MGWVEFRVIIIGVIFMFIFNLLVLSLVSSSDVEEFNQTDIINEVTDELGLVSGFITTALLNVGIFMFSLFGVNFITYISVLPLWVISALTLYNIIIVFALIFYLVERLWI